SGEVERVAARLALPDKPLLSVLPARDGRLWLGPPRGIRGYELQSGKIGDPPVDAKRADAPAPGPVYHLGEDATGAVWAASYGSDGAVHRIDPVSRRIERFGAATGLRSGEVDQLDFAPDGALLAAGGAGIDRLDAQRGRFAPLAGAPAQRVY